MAKENTDFVVIKLVSGDEIVAKKTGSTRTAFLLHRPMQMQRTTLMEQTTGEIRKNICIFRDWLEFTEELECSIPKDSVIMCLKATDDLVQRYQRELELLDNPKPRPTATPKQPKAESIEEFYTNLLKSLPKTGVPPAKSESNPFEAPKAQMPPQGNNAFPMVSATFHMPPEVFMNIILNLPLFEFDPDMMDDMGDEGMDDDSEDEPKPQNNPPKSKRNKPKKNSGDEPPEDWHGRFGFPK
jgi:hypothetical protein